MKFIINEIENWWVKSMAKRQKQGARQRDRQTAADGLAKKKMKVFHVSLTKKKT